MERMLPVLITITLALFFCDQKDYTYVGGKNVRDDLLLKNTVLDGHKIADVDGDGASASWTLIQDPDDFLNIGNGKIAAPKRLLGIPKVRSTLQYNRSGTKNEVFQAPFNKNAPTLVDMTRAALNVLNNKKGFSVLIESGAIDRANHTNASERIIRYKSIRDHRSRASIL
jgi:hypothetical protein